MFQTVSLFLFLPVSNPLCGLGCVNVITSVHIQSHLLSKYLDSAVFRNFFKGGARLRFQEIRGGGQAQLDVKSSK